MHVHIQGVHVFNLLDVVEEAGLLRGKIQPVKRNRLKQKISYIERGSPVRVLAGGRRAIMEELPEGGHIAIRLLDQ